MPTVSVLGIDAFFGDDGAGPPVVLGHSSTGSGGQWAKLTARLADNFRLLAPDHLGYGRTGGFSGELPLLDSEVAVIEALLDLAGEPVHLVGHSYGGSILVHTARRHPDRVRSLTVAEPTLFYLLKAFGKSDAHAEIKAVADRVIRYTEEGDPKEAARGFIGYWLGAGAYDAMDARVRAYVTGCMDKLCAEWRGAFDVGGATPDALAALDVPVHLIAGAKTTAAAAGVMDILKDIWPGARLTVIDGAGHMAPISHADAVNAAIEEFLDEIEDRPR